MIVFYIYYVIYITEINFTCFFLLFKIWLFENLKLHICLILYFSCSVLYDNLLLKLRFQLNWVKMDIQELAKHVSSLTVNLVNIFLFNSFSKL
jgi:hypothetical protein